MPRVRHAIRWDGRRWKVAQRWPGGTIVSDSAVLSARDVWVFGSAHVAPSVGTWHYDGRSWQRFETPFGDLSSASAVASDDIWAVGSDNFGIDNVVARWDGHAWTQLEVPGLPNEENHFPELRGIYAASPQDVWIVGDEYQSDGDDSSRTPLALHFDGAHLAAARRTGRPG